MAGGRRIRCASPFEKLHDCQLCIRGFKSEANLTKHLLKHAQNHQRQLQVVQWEMDGTTEISTQFVLTSFVGKKTGKFFSRLKSPTSHREQTLDHSPDRIYECIFCKLIFSNQDELGNHMNKHPLEDPYKCNVCGYYFRTNEDLSKHLMTHNEDEEYTCQRCGKGFIEKSQLTEHWKVHTSQRSHVCNVCGRGFKNLIALSRHLRKHTGERPYKCNLCDRSFISPLRLTHHSYTHTENWPILCEICGKGFARESQKLSHMNVHLDTNKVFKCKVCKETFNDRVCLKKHVKQHTEIRRYNCTLCKQSYSQEATLKTHMRSHAGQYACKCSFCGKGFSSKYYLKRHVPVHTRPRIQRVCAVCGKHCLSDKALQRHENLHKKAYQCQICKSGHTTKPALIRHMQDQHYDELLRKTESIKKEDNAGTHTIKKEGNASTHTIKTEGNASTHTIKIEDNASTHTSSPQVAKTADEAEIMAKLLTCYECSSCHLVYLDRDSCEKHLEVHNAEGSFVTETEQSTHINMAHSQLKAALLGSVGFDGKNQAVNAACVLMVRAGADHHPQQVRECNVCGQTFKRNVGKMVEHLKEHTEVDWPPKCDICGQTFKSKKLLPAHRVTHTNDWPFKCDQCDRGFFFKSKFESHMLVHTDEKAFKCDVCGKPFHRKPDLKKHMMKHTDLRPFQCDQCGKTFREKGHMKRHIATLHDSSRLNLTSSSEKPKRVKRKQKPGAEQSVPAGAQMTPSGKIFYACKVCLDAFTTKAAYVKHMKTHSSEEQPVTTDTQQFYM